MTARRLIPISALCSLFSMPPALLSSSGAGLQLSGTAMPSKAAIEQNHIGVGYMNQQAFEDAASAFKKALAEDPSFNLARVNLGIALYYDQDLDGALVVLQAAEKIEPLNPYVLFVLGLVYRNRGEGERAIAHFSKVAGIDARCAASHYNLGLLFSRQRRDKEAEAELRRALELDPNHASVLYNLGGLLLKTGRAEEGNRLLDRFRALPPRGRTSSGMGSGSQYGKMGQYAIAMDFLPPPASGPGPAIP